MQLDFGDPSHGSPY